MLVTFSSPAYANITMFGDIAIQLLKLMGQSGQVPGALLAEDIAPALQQLQSAIDAGYELETPSSEADEDEPVISISHRALPLIDLLKAADKQQCNVMWDH